MRYELHDGHHNGRCSLACPGFRVDEQRAPRIVARSWEPKRLPCGCWCHQRSYEVDYDHARALSEDARREVEEVDGPLMSGDVRESGEAGARALRSLPFYAALHGDVARMVIQNTVPADELPGVDPMFIAHDHASAPYRAYWYARYAASYGLALLERTEGR